jgi:hypothetical protein
MVPTSENIAITCFVFLRLAVTRLGRSFDERPFANAS